MVKIFGWEKKWFSNTYHIFEGETSVGSLKIDGFSGKGEGNIKGEIFYFKYKDWLSQRFSFTPIGTNEESLIKIDWLLTGATIFHAGKQFLWKKEGLSSNWKILSFSNLIYTKNSLSRGEAYASDSESDTLPLLMAGFYIHAHIQRANAYIIYTSIFMLFALSLKYL